MGNTSAETVELEKKQTSNIYSNQSKISSLESSTIRTAIPQMQTSIRNQVPELRCSSGYPIVSMCTNQSCQGSALFCEQGHCPCLSLHGKCSSIRIDIITTFLQKRADHQKNLFQQMQEIEDKALQACQRARKAVLQGFFLRSFDKKYVDIVNTIFLGGTEAKFNGKTADQFVWKLRESNSELATAGINFTNEIQREILRVTAALVKLEEKAVKQFINHTKVTDELPPPPKELPPPVLDSVIVTETSQIKFIVGALDNPKQFKRIFRASENDFKASCFHAICDNVPHTLTLVKNEFGRIIGGYNPLTWNYGHGFATDHTNLSCLLLVDSRIKATLVKPKKAIQCFANYGPIFGGGSDLALADSCNENISSVTNFPYSFNRQKNPLKFNQESWTLISGAPQGKNFRVIEYEIFKIVW